ncbi:hypothetical protein Zm00014a_022077 [Zea mays]|uniref:Uncharacterized protein n=1 Tax=Zea mays TaxID=4577 RepID=A0A3L6D819_MAIZE|nr:hypothetical protein Zm00014a_022077 [Zea mays]
MQAQGAGQASSAASRQAGVAQAAGQASSATSRRMGPGATRDQQPASSAGVARQSMRGTQDIRLIVDSKRLGFLNQSCMEKYRGIAPKKSLVSKDHEHAYFDSADWVDLSMIIKRKKTICTNQFIMPMPGKIQN